MENISFEELVQLKQDGKIGWCDFALYSEHCNDYLQWCVDHGQHPDDESAELFMEQTEEKLFEDFEPVIA